jgi:hypothetical protein
MEPDQAVSCSQEPEQGRRADRMGKRSAKSINRLH